MSEPVMFTKCETNPNSMDSIGTGVSPSEVSNQHSSSHFDDLETSSVDSFALTDSPDGTTISSRSYRSSHSSLSGLIGKASPNVCANLAIGGLKRKDVKTNHSSIMRTSLFSSDNDNSMKNEYYNLKHQCSKFRSRSNANKANYLRLTLLPFLRRCKSQLLPPTSELELPVKVFAMWWSQLLNVISNNFKNINGVDRNLFYEAISSLMARIEWHDNQDKHIYQSLLMQTTSHVLIKCASASQLTVAQAAFTGKVLAYAYFYIPSFAAYLLCLLPVDERVIQKYLKSDAAQDSDIILSRAQNHLRYLVNAQTVPKDLDIKKQLSWLPMGLCQGWNRHMCVNSSLFASFFKHFCSLQIYNLPFDNHIDEPEFVEAGRLASLKVKEKITEKTEAIFLAGPGVQLVLSSIYGSFCETLEESTHSVSVRNGNLYSLRKNRFSQEKGNYFDGDKIIRTGRPRIDLLKVFTAFREILHSDEDTSPYFLVFSRVFDRIFKIMAAQIRIHDMEGCVTICDIVEEWLSSVFSVRATISYHTLRAYKQLAVDWHFWLSVVQKMLESDNSHSEIRALSFLFNIWPLLPNYESLSENNKAGTNCSPTDFRSILRKTTEWILSESMWLRFFCHWSPLVRSYYHRILCYRLASVGVGTTQWILDVEYAQDLQESRELLGKMLMYTFSWCHTLSQRTKVSPETDPCLPLPRLRVGIQRFGPMPYTVEMKMETNVSRAYPFDVFDTAAYWKTSLNADHKDLMRKSSENRSGVCRSSSRVSRGSLESADSNISTLSNSSTFSVNSMKSQLRRLSLKVTGLGDSLKDGNESKPDNIGSRKDPPQSASSIDKWLFRRKSTPGNSATDLTRTMSQERSHKLNTFLAPALEIKEPAVNDESLPSPSQLTQPRPEIIRPAYRFVMVPTHAKPPARRTLSVPRLPFGDELNVYRGLFDPNKRPIEKDMVLWNYGGRSLAEWNIEVMCFEKFAQQQSQLVDTLEMFSMPFLVAEIPCRTAG